jgi:hypothetical protein
MGPGLFDFAQSAVWKWTGIFYLGGTN